MTVHRAVYSIAGFMVLLSLALAVFVSQWWLLLTAFVGANLFQAGFTGICPAEWIFKRCGLKECQ